MILSFILVAVFFTVCYLIPTPAPTGAPDWWPTAPYWWLTIDRSVFNYPFVQSLETYKLERPNGTVDEIRLSFGMRVLRASYLSIVTMTTRGFGDITPHPLSIWGHVLVMAQVLAGYVLLGALITRLAILFQEVS